MADRCKKCSEEDADPELKKKRFVNAGVKWDWTMILGSDNGASCCYEESRRKACESNWLSYKNKHTSMYSQVLTEEIMKDLVLASAMSFHQREEIITMKHRMEEMELRIQVLLDMKRLGEIDEENGLLKRKRRKSV